MATPRSLSCWLTNEADGYSENTMDAARVAKKLLGVSAQQQSRSAKEAVTNVA